MLLAIDTATDWVGMALHDGDSLRMEVGWQTRAGHTVELTPTLVQMLGRLDISLKVLSAIAVSLGPGSFTGLRIGLSLGKGLAYALKVPIVGIPTLDILAYEARHQALPVCAAIRAGRGRLAAGFYSSGPTWGPKGGHFLTTIEELVCQVADEVFFLGELDSRDRRILREGLGQRAVLGSPAEGQRRAGYLAELGWQRLNMGQADTLETLAPIYLH